MNVTGNEGVILVGVEVISNVLAGVAATVGTFADPSSNFTLNDAMVLANHFPGSSLQGTAKPWLRTESRQILRRQSGTSITKGTPSEGPIRNALLKSSTARASLFSKQELKTQYGH